MATKKVIKTSTQDLSVFSVEVSPSLIAQAIHVYRENSHRGVSKVKTRGEINKTKRKVYKQKGTGGARHGARSANIYVGGGVTFGPTGHRSVLKDLNQKMKVKALIGTLSLYQKENRLALIDSSEIKDMSTKSAVNVLGSENSAFVYYDESPGTLKAISNIENVILLSARRLNAYSVASSPKLFLTASAYDHLVSRLKLK